MARITLFPRVIDARWARGGHFVTGIPLWLALPLVAMRYLWQNLLRVGIDDVNGEVVVVGGKLPSTVLFFVESALVGEELVEDFAFVRGGGLVLVADDDAIVPSAIFRSVQAGAVDGVAGDVP